MRAWLSALLLAYLTLPAFAAPAVVELFTSQGCSSCPPAEAALNQTGHELWLKGQVLPLAFHVDYWNRLWKDPFSFPGATRRQWDYAAVWRFPTIYTPQLVVAGRVGFIGTDWDRVRKEASQAGRIPPLDLEASLSRARAEWDVRVRLGHVPDRALRLKAALYENGLVTHVRAGENKGRTLREDFVVRSWRETALVPGATEAVLKLPLPDALDPKRCGVVVLAQDPGTLEILGATEPLRPAASP